MTKQTFKEVQAKNFEKLAQFTPIVARVHGENHPEFHEVKTLWEQIYEKSNKTDEPELQTEFTQLRAITDNYTVPGDVCESYEAVYKMLEEVDSAYEATAF